MRLVSLFAIALLSASAQVPVAPTQAPVGPPRGEDVGIYNVTNSFEIGHRWRDVNGSLAKYRSDVNFGNGVRLLSSRLSVNSKDGHGRYFDEILLNTQGLGNDPYQFSSLRIQKNSLYRYDLLWRSNEYYNPALTISGGGHLIDTSRRLQDHSLVLLPQAPVRLHMGMSRWSQSGDGLSTVQLFDARGDEFPLNTDFRRSNIEYRLGFDVNLAGFKLTAVRAWENFKDDTRRDLTGPNPGFNPDDAVVASTIRRDEPYHGSTRSWRLNLLADRSQLYTVNGRFVYAGTKRDFIFDELAVATNRFGSPQDRQTLIFGSGRRPVTSGALTISLYPHSRVTLVNHTAFHSTRMEGDGLYRELSTTSFSFSDVRFNYLGIRTASTATDASVSLTRDVTVFAGHQFSARRIRAITQVLFDGATTPDRLTSEQDSTLNSGRAGIRLRAAKRLSLVLDGEIGRVDRPVFPTSERNYHVLSGRLQYKTRTLSASALMRTNYNFNSESLFAHSARSRNYSADLSWSPVTWGGFDASYSKIHLDTISGIAYFRTGQFTRDTSVYISNIHAATLLARASVRALDLFVGYTRVEDTGGDLPAGILLAPPTAASPTPLGFQTLPLTYDSPFARASVRVHPKLRFNVGYQFYRYDEQRLPQLLNYRAHTGFTSLLWSF